ncbi:MAG: MerR family transcriptional regulator [Caldilineaceae bacterium]|nr:MerR family transcriptional regulator [Caldilineaceae bacterium]
MNTINLADYPNTPLYNIKAVVKATGISSSTLRAWERRYQVAQPQRSDSGYRLYSDRDIILIRWLKTQVDAGMAISQVVSWLENLTEEAGELDSVLLPGNPESHTERMTPITQHLAIRDYESLQQDLIRSLLHFDEESAEHILAEAFALYPLELVGEKLVAPVLIEIGERWHRGEINVTNEHFATAYLQSRLAAILRTVPLHNSDSLIWVGCAPNEEHEIGAMLLTIYLRRAGYQVHYIGKNLPLVDLTAEVRRQQPTMILLSVSTEIAIAALQQVTHALSNLEGHRPIIGYGGRVFHNKPDLRNRITGIYMGDTALEAIESTNELLGPGKATVENVLFASDHEANSEDLGLDT